MVEGKLWSIDFCEDNLRDAVGANEAVVRLKQLLSKHQVIYAEQQCIHACRPCHAGVLIARVNDELVTGAANDEVIASIVGIIMKE
jgi:uncharacterized protein YuzB (UPF0349 family)